MIPHRPRQPLAAAAVLLVLALTVCPSLSSDVAATTSPPPPPSPPSNPERGDYNVTNNGTACLMARMGLQLNMTYLSLSQGKVVQEIVNLHPNQTRHSGSCEADSATLKLTENSTNLTFIFSLNSTSNKYHLSGLELSASLSDMTKPLSVSNTSLDFLEGTLGFSYMCREEQVLNVGENFSLNTFQLQVQPFGVSGDQFGAAEDCALDEDNMLIPIVVGTALAGLVLVVLLAYLIGRKRSHAGYQTI